MFYLRRAWTRRSPGKLLDDLERRDVEYTVSVPLGRFADLKTAVERRR